MAIGSFKGTYPIWWIIYWGGESSMKYSSKLRLFQNTIGRLPRSRFLYKLCLIYMRHCFGFNYGLRYDDGEIRFARYATRGKLSPVIFDVGANIGAWTLQMLKGSPTAQIHAFEPTPNTFMKLRAHLDSHNVVLNQRAVGSRSEVLRLYDYGHSEIASLHARDDQEPRTVHEVEVVSVPQYCIEQGIKNIDFLKIDAEGHDYEVLKGSKEMLNAHQIEVLQFEYGPANLDSHVLLKDIMMFFANLPYRLFRVYPRFILPIHRYTKDLENFISVNYVAILGEKVSLYNHYIRDLILY